MAITLVQNRRPDCYVASTYLPHVLSSFPPVSEAALSSARFARSGDSWGWDCFFGKFGAGSIFGYCHRKELVSTFQKPRETLCASEFHPLTIKKHARKVGGEAANFLTLFRVLEGWNSFAPSFARGYCKRLTTSFREQ